MQSQCKQIITHVESQVDSSYDSSHTYPSRVWVWACFESALPDRSAAAAPAAFEQQPGRAKEHAVFSMNHDRCTAV